MKRSRLLVINCIKLHLAKKHVSFCVDPCFKQSKKSFPSCVIFYLVLCYPVGEKIYPSCQKQTNSKVINEDYQRFTSNITGISRLLKDLNFRYSGYWLFSNRFLIFGWKNIQVMKATQLRTKSPPKIQFPEWNFWTFLTGRFWRVSQSNKPNEGNILTRKC